MPRTKLADRKLPEYTKGEEIANMVTHIVGAVFGLVALVLCVVAAALRGDAYRIVGSAIYGTSLIVLYTVSSVYHGLHPNKGKKVMQVIDHCMIYFLIAGTYTPIMLGPVRALTPVLAWTVLGLVWGISAFATVFTAIDHRQYRVLSNVCYIGIGWLVIFALKPTIQAITMPGFWYLLGGGIAYTVGAILYGIGAHRHTKYIHSVFHVFVVLGTVLQFITVYVYCM